MTDDGRVIALDDTVSTPPEHERDPVLPPLRPASLRLRMTARAAHVMITSVLAVVPFTLWITFVAVSPISLVAPLVLPATALVRAYANAHRRGVTRLLGTPMPPPYRDPGGRGMLRRIWQIVRDPASWRDAWWLLCHAVVGCVTATLTVALFAGSVFYLIYPFLYWVTPQRVFGHPFDHLTLHSVADATVLMPLALVCFALWYALVLPLTRLELSLARALLGPAD